MRGAGQQMRGRLRESEKALAADWIKRRGSKVTITWEPLIERRNVGEGACLVKKSTTQVCSANQESQGVVLSAVGRAGVSETWNC